MRDRPDDGLEGGHTLTRGGFAKVGPKTAYYRAWRVTCVAESADVAAEAELLGRRSGMVGVAR